MKRVLITGATGLIGSHLVVELIDVGGYQVTALIRSEESKRKLDEVLSRHGVTDAELSYVMVDTENFEELREVIAEFDVVYHCAAIVSFEGRVAEQIVADNVELTNYVVDSCLASERKPLLVHVSSIAALGSATYPAAVTEVSPFSGILSASAYARSKFLSENEVWRAARQGLRVVVVSPSVVLGLGASTGGGLQPLFRIASRGIPFYTDGVNGFVDVCDVALAMRLLSEDQRYWGRRYILSSEDLSYRKLITELNTLFGKRPPRIALRGWMLRVVTVVIHIVQRKPLVTKEMAGFLLAKRSYDGTLVKRTLSMNYTPLEQTLARIVRDSVK